MSKTLFSFKHLPLLLLIFPSHALTADVGYQNVLIAEEFPMGNMLAWSTAFEEDSELFFVERSLDGINFDNVGQLDAGGTTYVGRKYHFLDVGVQSEKVLYRLKQMDHDGTISFSDIITMRKTAENNFMVVRMNTTDVVKSFDITIDNLVEGKMNYQVSNLQNEVIENKEIDLIEGLNEVIVNVEDLPEGIYKVKLQMNNEIETLVIQRVMTEVKPVLRASKEKANKGG